MRKSGTFAAQLRDSSLPHTTRMGAENQQQYGCFHFYFLLFLLYTPFCSTRLGDQRARTEVKSNFAQRLPEVITPASGWSRSSPCSDSHSSAMEFPHIVKALKGNRAEQPHSSRICRYLKQIIPSLLSCFSLWIPLTDKNIRLAFFGFSSPSSALFSHLNRKYQVWIIFHWFFLKRKMVLKANCSCSRISDTENSC